VAIHKAAATLGLVNCVRLEGIYKLAALFFLIHAVVLQRGPCDLAAFYLNNASGESMKRRPLVWIVNTSCIALMLAVSGLIVNASGQAEDKKEDKKPEAPVAGTPVANPFNAFQHFSAVMNGGLVRDKDRKVYRSGKLMRTDFKDQFRVTDIDAPVTWIVFDKIENGAKVCSKVAIADGGDFPFYGLKDSKVTRVPSEGAGETKETVDGHTCKIENLVFVNSKINPPVTWEMTLSEAEDLNGFPIKIKLHNPMTDRHFDIDYTEVSLEKPDAKLFTHPDKCSENSQPIKKSATSPSTTPSNPKPAPTSPPQ
jgi:hypothetical protein